MSYRYDFSKTLLRCHYLGDICQSEGKSGGLSAAAKKKLVEVYWEEKYGKRNYVSSPEISKGKRSEGKAIELIGFALDLHFTKNIERITNEYLTGEPDIFIGEEIRKAKKVWDAKCSATASSFGANILEEKLNTDYEWQGHGYMGLTGAKEFATAYCLVTDEISTKDKQKSIFYGEAKWATEDNPEWEEEAAKIELAMTFDDIKPEERILIFPVARDESKIIRIYSKVVEARDFLSWYQDKHLGFNQKIISIAS
jgi:hypothetical protein